MNLHEEIHHKAKKTWLIPGSGVVFSSTIVLGPKARDSKAQANGLGL
jgi:hypothetical protein